MELSFSIKSESVGNTLFGISRPSKDLKKFNCIDKGSYMINMNGRTYNDGKDLGLLNKRLSDNVLYEMKLSFDFGINSIKYYLDG